jgi:hypothetical protein
MTMQTTTCTRLCSLALAGLALAACDLGSPALETRTFRVQHMNAGEAARLVDPYVYGEREGRPGAVSVVDGALTVRETRDNLDEIERVLAEYDVPRPDIRLHFQLIEADGFTEADPRIADVEDELRKLFRFQGYRLAGEATVVAADFANVEQLIRAGDDLYSLNANVSRVGPDATRLQDVSLVGRGVQLTTSMNVRPGQTVVLGSSPRSGDTATLFLTVRALGPVEPD